MQKSRRLRAMGTGLLVAVAVAGLWLVSRPTEPDLLARATLLANFSALGRTEGAHYQWAANDTVVLEEMRDHFRFAVTWLKLPNLTKTTRQLQLTSHDICWQYYWPYHTEPLSPDGKWVLVNSDRGVPFLIEVATGRKRPCTSPVGGPLSYWLPDCRHWLTVSGVFEGKPARDASDVQAFIYGVDGSLNTGPILYWAGHTLPNIKPIGLTPQRHLIGIGQAVFNGEVHDDIEDYDLAEGKHGPSNRRPGLTKGYCACYPLTLPAGTQLEAAELSPSGDRIAYLLGRYSGPAPPIIHRIFPNWDRDHPSTLSVWVSRENGTGLHEIGACPQVVRRDPVTRQSILDYPRRLHWTPNSKRLSFFYGNELYTVRVD